MIIAEKYLSGQEYTAEKNRRSAAECGRVVFYETLPTISGASSHFHSQLISHVLGQSSLRLCESGASEILGFHGLSRESVAGHG